MPLPPSPPPTSPAATAPLPPSPGLDQRVSRHFVRQVLGGVILILPLVITVWIVWQIYVLANQMVVDPLAAVLLPKSWLAVSEMQAGDLGRMIPWRIYFTVYVLKPVVTLSLVLGFLYFMGYVFQTRLRTWMDWFLTKIPGVSVVYSALRDVLLALQGENGLKSVDTVVLVPFPHSSARMAGYLMGNSQDAESGQEVSCVYVPICLFPPSGYTIMLPRDEVIVTDWEPKETWKLLLSGGLTVPPAVPYTQATAKGEG